MNTQREVIKFERDMTVVAQCMGYNISEVNKAFMYTSSIVSKTHQKHLGECIASCKG